MISTNITLKFLKSFDEFKMDSDGSGVNFHFWWITFDENGDHCHNYGVYHTNYNMTAFKKVSGDTLLSFEELFTS